MKDWLKEYKHDKEAIYNGLMLDLLYYLKQLMLDKGFRKPFAMKI